MEMGMRKQTESKMVGDLVVTAKPEPLDLVGTRHQQAALIIGGGKQGLIQSEPKSILIPDSRRAKNLFPEIGASLSVPWCEVAVYDYIWKSHGVQASISSCDLQQPDEIPVSALGPGGITSHVAVYTVYPSGFQELYRHFLRLPSGAIVELTVYFQSSLSLIGLDCPTSVIQLTLRLIYLILQLLFEDLENIVGRNRFMQLINDLSFGTLKLNATLLFASIMSNSTTFHPPIRSALDAKFSLHNVVLGLLLA
ncbi:hypothetical protein CB1_000526018 [Camelus ferus]|nr:hypothetical protein CB1_000526018 [Camelus ferus]